ncbi:hypothetical protein HGA64_03520 [Candidatus Falkowbacteria bacterium]|nr:hypothetical protein [Candidatus Falkowbacteria bacterium]
MSKKFALGNVATQPQPKPLQNIGVLMKEEPSLDVLRKSLNTSLIEKLKSLYAAEYGTDKWKYRLIKNVKEYQKQDMQHVQLIQFEKGANHTANFLLMILSEIARLDKSADIQIFRDGVKIR